MTSLFIFSFMFQENVDIGSEGKNRLQTGFRKYFIQENVSVFDIEASPKDHVSWCAVGGTVLISSGRGGRRGGGEGCRRPRSCLAARWAPRCGDLATTVALDVGRGRVWVLQPEAHRWPSRGSCRCHTPRTMPSSVR